MKIQAKYLLALLSLVASCIFLAVVFFPDKNLHLIACNVGQGDAILAFYGSTQVLIDGGPGTKVLDCLSSHLPFWDRKIELVLLTHPQADHFMGLIEVFKRYRVDYFLANGLDSSSPEYQVLKNLVGGGQTKVINPTTGMVIGNSLMHLDIIYPTKKFIAENSKKKVDNVLGAYTSNKDANDFSIVAILSLKEFDALLTGDIGPAVIDEIISTGKVKPVEYIKIPHHGSKNGLTPELLEIAQPKVAIISVGKNQWGHPHEEILSILRNKKIKILRTDEIGDIEVVSDGKNWWVKE